MTAIGKGFRIVLGTDQRGNIETREAKTRLPKKRLLSATNWGRPNGCCVYLRRHSAGRPRLLKSSARGSQIRKLNNGWH